MAAASASASLHYYLECAKAPKRAGSSYTSKECTLASYVEKNGKYLLKVPEGKGATFKTKGGVSTLYAYIPNLENLLEGGTVVGKVVCKKSKGQGEIEDVNLATQTITFEGCESEGVKCASGAKAGVIETKKLSTTPVLGLNGESLLWTYAAAALVELGGQPNQLNTEEKALETPLAEFKCGAKSVRVLGSVLGLLTAPELEVASKTAIDDIKVIELGPNCQAQQEHIFFNGDTDDGQAYLSSDIYQPEPFFEGLLPASLETTQTLKGGDIGIYPPEGFAEKADGV
jgi:hypothetical protein